MADLTPEMLAQLEKDVARLREERAARRGPAPAAPTEQQPISAAEELP